MDHTKFPELDKALLDFLNERFPERCAEVNESERQIFIYAGQRSVVRLLNEVYKAQTEVDADIL